MNIKHVSIDNLEESTPQEVFDFVTNHLLTQMEQSTIGYTCMYRSGNLKCAAGCLIPDEKYLPEMDPTPEGIAKVWSSLIVDYGISSSHGVLITRLQEIHDQFKPHNWKIELRNLASNFQFIWNFGENN